MPKRKETTQEEAKKPAFSMTLRVNGIDYSATGDSIAEMVDNLDIDYTKIKSKGELRAKSAEREHYRVFAMAELRRIFASKLRMGGFIRDLGRLL